MKPSSTFRRAAVGMVSLSAMASAWPAWLPELNALVARQDSSSSTPSSATQTTTSAPKTTNLNTGITGSAATAKSTGKAGSGSNSTTHTTFDVQDGVGSVVMITPASTASTQLYKIGNQVTWGWNYTSLQGTPTAVDVLISCSAATKTYTLTQNMTFTTPGSFVWDTTKDEYKNLVVEQYTLIVHDSDSAITATAEAGYLSAFSGYTFGVYTKRPYTPLASGWQCVSCSGAAPSIDRRAVGFAVAMGGVTVLTFTWFVTGFGVFAL